MKLQIKDAGSWRNVVEFDAERRAKVMAAAVPLLKALHHKTVLRVADDRGVSQYHCSAPDYIWKLT